VNGATNLSGGLDLGFEQLRKRTVKNATASILLLTDGVANLVRKKKIYFFLCIHFLPKGIIENSKIIEFINAKLRLIASSINVFTFGFGYNHSPQMLTAISDAGLKKIT
jgi:secreted protein with Ig-like and vWFA domain